MKNIYSSAEFYYSDVLFNQNKRILKPSITGNINFAISCELGKNRK